MKKPENPRNLIGAITIAVLLSSIASHGAPITWAGATYVATTADVSTTGAFVEAFNLSSRAADTSTVTVNGVTFTGLTSPSPLTNPGLTASAHLNGNTSGDVGYNSLLNTAAFGGGTSTSITVGGGNLINGREYLIQVWYVEERTTGTPALNTRQMIYGSPGGSTVTVGGTAGLLGQYAIGTFTADGPNQTLTLATPGAPFLQSHLTAYQIRETGTPPVIAIAGSSLGVNNWFSAGFGNAGYLFASTDNDDPAAGPYKRGGVIYTAAETSAGGQNVLFTRLSPDLKPWSNNGINPGNLLTAALNVDLENPAGGTFKAGSFWNAGLNGDLPVQSFRLTFGQAVPQGYRLGILLGAAESQGEASTFTTTTGNLRDIPYQLSVNGVTVATTQTALDGIPDWLTTEPADPNTGVPSADWYFFDLTDIKPGSSVTISAARIYSANSHKFNPINGLALAALATGPSITGVNLSGTTLTLDFTGEPGVTNWKIMAGTDLQSFPIDETPGSISEGPPGVYQALVDVTGDPPRYFLRVEQTR